MWIKPWTLKEGCLIGAGLIIAGLMLELSVGPVVWDAFSWPVNGIVLAGLLVMIAIIHLLRRHVYAFSFLSTYAAAIPAIAFAVILTLIMGLTRQTVNGSWMNDMLSFWPFVLIYVYIAVIIGLAVLKRLSHFLWKRDIPFLFNHLGLFLALTCATLGNADMQRLKMITAVGEPEWRVMDENRQVKELDVAIELQKFIMEQYEDGSPKRFASEVNIMTKSGKNIHTTIDVNKPAEVEGWKIYQYGYDTAAGPQSQISIFELVRDPWLPLVYVGIGLMLAGALCMFILSQRRQTL
jgi:hypothetical protein